MLLFPKGGLIPGIFFKCTGICIILSALDCIVSLRTIFFLSGNEDLVPARLSVRRERS